MAAYEKEMFNFSVGWNKRRMWVCTLKSIYVIFGYDSGKHVEIYMRERKRHVASESDWIVIRILFLLWPELIQNKNKVK